MNSIREVLIIGFLVSQTPAIAPAKSTGVVDIANSFTDGGGYEWKGSGVPEAVVFKGQQILPKG